MTASGTTYSLAPSWYDNDPDLINRVPATNLEVAVRDSTRGKASFVPVSEIGLSEPMDGTGASVGHRRIARQCVWQQVAG